MDSCEAKEYALNHPLPKPQINWSNIVACFALIELGVVVMSLLFSKNVLLCIILANITLIVTFSKSLLKIIIRCYQRYAPEHIRRRCKCKPSCSEYALLALDKYFLPKALCMIYIRLRYTCRGEYKIDFP